MELQLGLSLARNSPAKGLDLNTKGYSGLTEISDRSTKCCLEGRNKRSFSEAFEHERVPKETLMLVSWNDQPNEEDDHAGEKRNSHTLNQNGGDQEDNHVVGWPPLKSSRKKLLTGNVGHRNSMHVKVKMEGVAIGRKINLRLHHSYQTLTNTLITMFAKYQRPDRNGGSYRLTYQDKDGDWLLAGDVPWQTFIESVCRLEIQKSSPAG
ncbi:hypothetical protein NMG60_11000933 [Bertholletia excelsa]